MTKALFTGILSTVLFFGLMGAFFLPEEAVYLKKATPQYTDFFAMWASIGVIGMEMFAAAGIYWMFSGIYDIIKKASIAEATIAELNKQTT